MMKALFILALLSCLSVSTAFGQEHHAHPNAKEKPDSAADPLVEEMIKLDSVFRDVVSAVALNDANRVLTAIHSMHGAMEKTHEGVHQGTVRIPRNADRIEDFVRQDRQFHADLQKLGHAAGKNDADGMVRLTKKLLDECVACHRMFRAP